MSLFNQFKPMVIKAFISFQANILLYTLQSRACFYNCNTWFVFLKYSFAKGQFICCNDLNACTSVAKTLTSNIVRTVSASLKSFGKSWGNSYT